MKKILFLFLVFLSFNFISKANFIPLEQCYGGGYAPVGQCPAPPPAPRKYGGVSIDPVSRKYGATWNYGDGENAQYDAAEICMQKAKPNKCVSYWSSFYYTAVAVSSDDKVTKFGSADSYDSAWKDAVAECKNAGGYDCEVVLMTSSTSKPDEKRWGSLSYDINTGKWGKAWNHYTRREAVAASEKSCGSPECASLGFQSTYGAMAMSPDKKLIVGLSNKNMKDAEKDAVKRCKKEFKAKTCEIVVEGMAEGETK